MYVISIAMDFLLSKSYIITISDRMINKLVALKLRT